MSNKTDRPRLRILLGYSYYESEDNVRKRVEGWLERLRAAGFQVEPFVLTLDPPKDRLSWKDLEHRWKRKEKSLLTMYDQLAAKLENYDVFINWNGINVHPEVLQTLPSFKVYACFDDPESSDDLSRPVAAAYDCCMVGNIACLSMYRNWKCKNVGWWPLGFHPTDFSSELTADRIREGFRDVSVSMLCERLSNWRGDRLDRVTQAFPEGKYYGRGWRNGFLPEADRVPLLQRSCVAINIHNSIGPVNYRTFYLPANGVLQVCDNREHLASIFALDKEVIAYDTIEDAIDKVRYYLSHDRERREIAANGFERAKRDYNEIEVFSRVMAHIETACSAFNTETATTISTQPKYSYLGSLQYRTEVAAMNLRDSIYRRTKPISHLINGPSSCHKSTLQRDFDCLDRPFERNVDSTNEPSDMH